MEMLYTFTMPDEVEESTHQVMGTSDEAAITRLREKYPDDEERITGLSDEQLLACITERTEYEGWDEFEAEFTPLPNESGREGAHPFMFDSIEEDYKHVRNMHLVAPGCVWTLIEEDGIGWIVPGLAIVNRVGYFLTDKPWKTYDRQFLYWD